MPELPDVEVFRRYFESTALKQRIDEVDLRDASLLEGVSAKRLKAWLVGRLFTGACRHGKYLFCATDAKPWLVLHFGMSGFLKYGKAPEAEAPHTRLLLRFDNGYALAYDNQRKLGRISLTEDVEAFVAQKELGPDAWEPPLSRDALAAALKGRRAAVKSALMDQSAIAGLGNEYVDEILFHAGLDPRRKAKDMGGEEIAAIGRNLRHVLREAISRGADAQRYPESWLLPRRAQGQSCPNCSRELSHVRVNSRHTVFCARCQNARS